MKVNKFVLLAVIIVIVLVVVVYYSKSVSYSPALQNKISNAQLVPSEIYKLEGAPEGTLVGDEAKQFILNKIKDNPNTLATSEVEAAMLKFPERFSKIVVFPDENGNPKYIAPIGNQETSQRSKGGGLLGDWDWLQGKCRVELKGFQIPGIENEILPVFPFCVDHSGQCERWFGSIASCHQNSFSGSVVGCLCTLGY